jgi:hypothetical protein
MADPLTPGLDVLNQTNAPVNQNLLPALNPQTQAQPVTLSPVAKRELDPIVGKVAPALYAAGSTAALSSEEQNLLENWSKVKDLHDGLMALPNAQAEKKYNLLTPAYQKALYDYYGIDYGTKPSNSDLVESEAWRKTQGNPNQDKSFFDNARQVVASPFRWIMGGAQKYAHILTTPIHMLENSAINNQSFWSKANVEASFSGKMLYDNGELNKLIETHGQETAYVATHILAGEGLEQIIQSYGPKSKALLAVINQVLNDSANFQVIIEDFDRARLSPGRDVARWVNKAFGIKTEENKGLFKFGSGLIDAAFVIAADPLTYLTFGSSAVLKGASQSTKLAEKLLETRSIADHFANPNVARFWDGYGKQIDALKIAREENNTAKAAEITNNIQRNFAEHGTIEEIETFLSGAKGVDGPFSFKDYFLKLDDFSSLLRGATADTRYAREGVAIARKTRATTLGIKQKVHEFFVGKADYSKLNDVDVDTFLNEALKVGADRTGTVSWEVLDKLTDAKLERGFRAFVRRQTSYAPGSTAIKTGDDAVETAEIFRRQAFVALNDRVLSDTLTQHFLEATQADRINIKRYIDEATFRRFGVHKMGSTGREFMDKILDASYGTKDSFLARENLEMPKHSGSSRAGQELESVGPVLSHQFQDRIKAINWRTVKEFTAGKYVGEDLANESNMEKAARIIGGAYSNKVSNAITDAWSVLTLIPQLGIRTAWDEGYQFAMYMNLPMIKNIWNAKRMQKVMAAYNGNPAAYGPAKAALFKTLERITGSKVGPVSFIDKETKFAMREAAFAAPKHAGKTSYEIEKIYRREVFDLAISKYGTRLPTKYKEFLYDMADLNPTALMDTASSRNIGKSITGMSDDMFKTDSGFISDDNLIKAMEAHGVLPTGVFRSIPVDRFTKTDLQLHMFRQFVTSFNARAFVGHKEDLDLPALFLKHRGLPAAKNWDNAINEFLDNLGFTPQMSGLTIPNNSEAFLKLKNGTTQFDKYKGMSDLDAARSFAEDAFANIYHIFHGDANQFNQKLVDYFMPFIDPALPVKDHRILLHQMDLEKYQDLTINHLAKGRIFTELDTQVPSFLENIRRYGINGAYDAMARQTDSILRQPAVHLHYLHYREQYLPMQERMANSILKDFLEEYKNAGPAAIARAEVRAQEQAARHFTEKSLNDAATHILKFSDNPEMRTIFADNIRSVGRFYRAVEDFHRRSYRLVRDNGMNALYRMRLQTQGLSAVGTVHTDQSGEQYVVLPFDNVLFSAVNNALRLITGKEGVTQPSFDNITFKLNAGNPSFQNDAGMPYLSGPLAGVSVLLAKGILSVPDVDLTNQAANKVDNFALGSYGDNVNLQKVFMPRSVQTLWNTLSPDEKSQQEVSALTQAISYNVAHDIQAPDPEDFKDASGNVDVEKYTKYKADYLNNIKISAHNIVTLRGLLGMILPSTVQLSDTKDLPDYLKEYGYPSLQSSFYAVLDGINEKHPDVQDPYELALATWMGENPGKLVYTLSKKDKEIIPIMKFSKDMESWVVKNKGAIDKYGSAATLFAPNTGKFNPGSYNYMVASGLTNNVNIDAFYQRALMQSAVNRYYDINEEEANQLKLIPFTDTVARQAVLANNTKRRQLLKLSVPGLEDYLGSTLLNKESYDFTMNAHAFVNDYPGEVKPEIKDKINMAYQIYSDFAQYVNNVKTWDAVDGTDLKLNAKETATQQLLQLVKSDDTKILEQYYNYGIKKLMGQLVRDTRVSVSRNE